MIILSLLRSSEVFTDLSDKELRLLSTVLRERCLLHGEQIVLEQDASSSFFIVIKGSVDISRLVPGKNACLIWQAKEGDIFGEQAFLDVDEKGLAAIASQESSVLVVNCEMLRDLTRVHPDVGVKVFRAFAKSFSRQLSRVGSDLLQLALSSHLSSLGEMAMSIGHEINCPLSVLQLKLDDIGDLLSSNHIDKVECHQQIATSKLIIERISKIVTGLKTVGRNSMNDPMVLVKVSDLIKDTLNFCCPRFKTKDVGLKICDIADEVVLHCRPAQISQVIMNLINNAMDAVRSLDSRWIEVDAGITASEVWISVTDSGLGIPEEIRRHIFRPYFTTKALGQGTGLGLCISQKIVESHGGTLSVDERSSQTRFVVRIPSRETICQSN